MSLALQLLIGGALFTLAQLVAGVGGIVALALVLLMLELRYDLRRYRHDHDVAYQRWERWHG